MADAVPLNSTASSVPTASTQGEGEGSAHKKAAMAMRSTRSATKALTAQFTQQEIMRQVVKDESLSGDTTSLYSSWGDSKTGDKPDVSAMTGDELMNKAMSKERNAASLKQSVHIISKDLRKTGVSRRALLRAVMEDERQFKTCLTLPMTIFFSSLFIAFFQMHYTTNKIFLQEAALRDKITTAPFNAETQADIYDWMTGTMFPWLWTLSNVPGSTSPDSVAKEQILVAGVLIKTARSPTTAPCESVLGNDTTPCMPARETAPIESPVFDDWSTRRRLEEVDDMPTSPWLDWMGFRSRPFRNNAEREMDRKVREARRQHRRHQDSPVWRDAEDRHVYQARQGLPGPQRRLSGASNRRTKLEDFHRQRRLKELMLGYMDSPVSLSGDVYKYPIPMSQNLSSVVQMVNRWRDGANPVINPNTLFFSVEFYIKSNDADPGAAAMLTYCNVRYMFSRGGGLYTEIALQTVGLKMKFTAMGVLALFIIALLRLTIVYFLTAFLAAKRMALKTTLMKFANIVDLAIIFFGWAILLCVAIEALATSGFSSSWDDYNDEVASTAQADLQDVDKRWLLKIHDDLTSPRRTANELISFVTNYNMLLLLRFLVATMGHPRLAIIARTMLHGMSDLLHLFFVFLLVFCAYVQTGHILMGQRMEELSTFKAAFGYCLQIVFQREYQYDRLTDENMAGAALWIVTFVLMLVLVLVNLMLAMIFDNYGTVRDQVAKNETVAVFVKRLVTQLRLQSAWISNTDLLVKLVQIPATESPSMSAVRRQFPEISQQQLDLVFAHASQKQTQMISSASKHSLSEYVAGLLLYLRDVREGVRMMRDNTRKEKPDTVAPAGKTNGMNGNSAEATDNILSASDVNPPAQKPDWVQAGLIGALRKQHEVMNDILDQMEQMNMKMADRGLQGSAGFSLERPARPDVENWGPPPIDCSKIPVDCSKIPVVVDCSKVPKDVSKVPKDASKMPKDASKVKK